MHPTPPPSQPSGRPPFLAAADPGVTPAGWYTVADGREIWWDGNTWVTVPHQAPQYSQQVQPYPTQSVTSVPVRTAHTAHLIATICTCGLWAPVWLISAIVNGYRTEQHVTRTR